MVRLVNIFLFIHLLGFSFFLVSPGSGAETASVEIDHLLAYIEESGCTFIRNGKTYSAIEGRHHIARKYEHLKKKIDSAEDFIKYGATKSSMSGRLYKVVCGGEEMLSVDWLHAELARFRNSRDRSEAKCMPVRGRA